MKMSRDRELGKDSARETAQRFYGMMEKIAASYHTGPRWGGAVYAKEPFEFLLNAQCESFTDVAPGERWPLTLRGKVDFNRLLPRERKFVGSASLNLLYRDVDYPRAPRDQEHPSFEAEVIRRYDEVLSEVKRTSGIATTQSLTVYVYGGELRAREVPEKTASGHDHQTDFYFDFEGNCKILGRKINDGDSWYQYGSPLHKASADELPFTTRLVKVVDLSLHHLQAQLERAQQQLRLEPVVRN